MNREIKFRCWIKPYYKFDKCKKDYRMIYPHLEKDKWYVIDCQSQTLMDGEGGKISDYKMYLQQFTGLKDKNGKEIYEGDVCKYKKLQGFDCEDYEHTGKYKNSKEVEEDIDEIKFIDGEFYPREDCSIPEDAFYAWRRFDFEVIGNVFENKDLLK